MTIEHLFEKLLKFKSITPDDAGGLDFIEAYLEDFEAIRIDKEDVKNLFMYKRFGDGPHLCFAGHIDVVPAGDGWDSDPFEPKFVDGKVYARGTQDMKSGLCAFLKALKDTKEFDGTLSILITSDEEGEAKYGTVEVLKYLKQRDFLPNFAIVAEPTCENIFGDAIKVGRRGSINGKITLTGLQGHAAYPEKSDNPINTIANILPNIAGINLDDGDEYFAPSKFVITDIRAGMQVTNVTPGKLEMMFNVRNSTKTSKKEIEEFVAKNFEGTTYTLELSGSAMPFVTDKNSRVVTSLQESIKEILDIDTKLSTAGGTSDARFFGEYGVDTVEFGVINDTIHAPNEYTKMEYVVSLTDIFESMIKKF
jgi:succinyl-diaminopimelate desuccinylase